MGHRLMIMLVIVAVITMNMDMCMGVCMFVRMDSIAMTMFVGTARKKQGKSIVMQALFRRHCSTSQPLLILLTPTPNVI